MKFDVATDTAIVDTLSMLQPVIIVARKQRKADVTEKRYLKGINNVLTSANCSIKAADKSVGVNFASSVNGAFFCLSPVFPNTHADANAHTQTPSRVHKLSHRLRPQWLLISFCRSHS